jgi:hypothetical protein
VTCIFNIIKETNYSKYKHTNMEFNQGPPFTDMGGSEMSGSEALLSLSDFEMHSDIPDSDSDSDFKSENERIERELGRSGDIQAAVMAITPAESGLSKEELKIEEEQDKETAREFAELNNEDAANKRSPSHTSTGRRNRMMEPNNINFNKAKTTLLVQDQYSDQCYNHKNPCGPDVLCDGVFADISGVHPYKYRQCYASCTESDGSIRLCKRKWLKSTSPFYVCKGHQHIVDFRTDSKGEKYLHIDHTQNTKDISLPVRIYLGDSGTHGFIVDNYHHLVLIRQRAREQNVAIRKMSDLRNNNNNNVDRGNNNANEKRVETKTVDAPMFKHHDVNNYQKSFDEINNYIRESDNKGTNRIAEVSSRLPGDIKNKGSNSELDIYIDSALDIGIQTLDDTIQTLDDTAENGEDTEKFGANMFIDYNMEHVQETLSGINDLLGESTSSPSDHKGDSDLLAPELGDRGGGVAVDSTRPRKRVPPPNILPPNRNSVDRRAGLNNMTARPRRRVPPPNRLPPNRNSVDRRAGVNNMPARPRKQVPPPAITPPEYSDTDSGGDTDVALEGGTDVDSGGDDTDVASEGGADDKKNQHRSVYDDDDSQRFTKATPKKRINKRRVGKNKLKENGRNRNKYRRPVSNPPMRYANERDISRQSSRCLNSTDCSKTKCEDRFIYKTECLGYCKSTSKKCRKRWISGFFYGLCNMHSDQKVVPNDHTLELQYDEHVLRWINDKPFAVHSSNSKQQYNVLGAGIMERERETTYVRIRNHMHWESLRTNLQNHVFGLLVGNPREYNSG